MSLNQSIVFIAATLLYLISSGYCVPKFSKDDQLPRFDGRIVGGQVVNIAEIPYQVSLQRMYHFCGGSLIAKRYVLTAAHCTDGSQAMGIKVRLGSNYTDRGGLLVNVVKVHQHPDYNSAIIDYDYSILELEEYNMEITYDQNNIGFIRLPSNNNEDVEDGEIMLVSGWGNTQNSNESRDQLRAVHVPKVNQLECREAYDNFGNITARMICAGYTDGGKDACQGDSGGPMIYNSTLVGIVSWGFGCARPNYPGVYSRVAVVRDWIRKIAQV